MTVTRFFKLKSGGLVAALLTVTAVFGGPEFIGKVNHADGIFRPGEKIDFEITLVDKKNPSVSGIVVYELLGGDKSCSGKFVYNGEPFRISTTSSRPDWVRCLTKLVDKDGNTVRNPDRRDSLKRPLPVEGGIGAVVSPEKFHAAVPEPADYDEFWKARRAEVDAVPLKAHLTQLKNADAAKYNVTVYDVRVDCAGGKPVAGLLAMPKAEPKSLPAVVFFHSAGVKGNTSYHWLAGPHKAMVFDVNAHGIATCEPAAYYTDLRKGELLNYVSRGIKNPATCYLTGMFMRAMRALEFMKSLPEWDGKNLILFGGSQGGAQILGAAALDQDVNLILFRVPGLCNNGAAKGNPPYTPGWPFGQRNSKPEFAAATPYLDGVNFARRINPECEAHITVGFVDTVSPAPGVYAAFNSLRTKNKHIYPDPDGTHMTTQKNMLMERLLAYLKEVHAGKN